MKCCYVCICWCVLTQCVYTKCRFINHKYLTSLPTYPDLGGGDGVDEGGLLEAVVAGGDGHLPARVDGLVDDLAGHLLLRLALVSLHIQLHVVLETLHLQPAQQIMGFTFIIQI